MISSVELLYCLININTWAYHNNPGTDFRIGPSAGSMLIFNSILISIGYNPIPIYAIDFAAYSLDQEGFTAYILFIMSKVEGQEIRHELPPSLFEALNRDSGI